MQEIKDNSGEVCVFLATGFEEIEALTTVDLLRRVDVPTRMVSITDEKRVVGAQKIEVIADCLLSEVDFEQVGMIVLPGGMPGTKNLAESAFLMEKVRAFDIEKKYISAICAAPSILGDLGILQDREAVCFPGFEDRLSGAKVVWEPVKESGHILTSRSMGTAMDFAFAIVRRMTAEDTAEKLAQKILYKKWEMLSESS